MTSATVKSPIGAPLRPLRPLHPSCTRSVGILGLGPLCFLFFVFPSRPLPLTPPGRALNVRSKTLRPATAQPCSYACHAHAQHARDGAPHRDTSHTPREKLATNSARRRALSVAAVRLRAVLGMPANELGMRHRERGARALDSSTSPMERIAHR